MAFAAARMILKDKRRKPSKEDFAPRNRSKVKIAHDYVYQTDSVSSFMYRAPASSGLKFTRDARFARRGGGVASKEVAAVFLFLCVYRRRKNDLTHIIDPRAQILGAIRRSFFISKGTQRRSGLPSARRGRKGAREMSMGTPSYNVINAYLHCEVIKLLVVELYARLSHGDDGSFR